MYMYICIYIYMDIKFFVGLHGDKKYGYYKFGINTFSVTCKGSKRQVVFLS
jgi:hypothetical protein